jgi:hypothetical protein
MKKLKPDITQYIYEYYFWLLKLFKFDIDYFSMRKHFINFKYEYFKHLNMKIFFNILILDRILDMIFGIFSWKFLLRINIFLYFNISISYLIWNKYFEYIYINLDYISIHWRYFNLIFLLVKIRSIYSSYDFHHWKNHYIFFDHYFWDYENRKNAENVNIFLSILFVFFFNF